MLDVAINNHLEKRFEQMHNHYDNLKFLCDTKS